MDETNIIDLESMMKNVIKPIQINDESNNYINYSKPTPSISTKIQNVSTPNANLLSTPSSSNNNNSNPIDDTSNLLDSIFSKYNIVLLSWFLTIYFVIYIILSVLLYKSKPKTEESFLSGIMGNNTQPESKNFTNIPSLNILSGDVNTSRTIDFTILICTIIFCGVYYNSLSEYDKTHILTYIVKWCYEDLNDPSAIVVFTLILIGFYLMIYLLRIPMTHEAKPLSIEIIESKLWIWIIIILIVNFFKYILGISILDTVYNWIKNLWNGDWSSSGIVSTNDDNNLASMLRNDYNVISKEFNGSASENDSSSTNNLHGSSNPYHNVLIDDGHDFKIIETPKTHSTSTPSPTTNNNKSLKENSKILHSKREEVYNIADNAFTYNDAQNVCKAFGGSLANYEQIEKSYNDGGEWCNYGWSDNQMALFPTQIETWNKLQKSDKYKNNCGRPGVNGGYMENKDLLFGVNCYGIKPSPTDANKTLMKIKMNSLDKLQPKNVVDTELDNKVKYWKDKADTLLINSFNNKKWSEY